MACDHAKESAVAFMSIRERLLLICMLLLLGAHVQLSSGTFATIETRSLDGVAFSFPHDALKEEITLFALAMGTSRESGEIQQEQLLRWQKLLESDTGTLVSIPLYHFPVLDVPRFIQGVVRRGIAKSYEGVIPADRGAILFMRQPETFATQAGIPIDDRATIAVVRSDGTIIGFVKGPPSTQGYDSLRSLVEIR